ncbi:copper resistance system multicopper oxidase [Acetobacter pasteurianus]|nr:copper resistance system multicopper oxidase [Acetobacter pasteurianus]
MQHDAEWTIPMHIPPVLKGRNVSRRQFITGGSALAALYALKPPKQAFASALTSGIVPPNASNTFDLTIGWANVNILDKPQRVPTMNGGVPGPILRWREGDDLRLNIHNTLDETTSIHWHGIRCPAHMDGVPGLSFVGIEPGARFTYRFPVKQSGTYWYHSHSNMQEAMGLYGAIVIDPKEPDPNSYDRDYVILLSDWSDVAPHTIINKLKFQDDYYNFRQRTAVSFFHDVKKSGVWPTLKDRMQWAGMNMSATDISDVSGIIYTYLMNGCAPAANWTGIFKPGERIRLRFINAAAMTFYDIRIPGLQMDIIQADGNNVEPVRVDEFRIGVAETYDCIVQPQGNQAYTIFAQSEDKTGYARGTLAPHSGMSAPVPPMDERPVRTMVDMGMAMHGGHDMGSMNMHDMPMHQATKTHAPPLNVENQNRAAMPINRLADPGDGLQNNGRRVLTYADLRATHPATDQRPPSREITLHLTGNMERYIWGFDGKKFSEAEPIPLRLGERVRFTLINDTMMEHPIHLHGLWSELENGNGLYNPVKHTIIAQPGGKLSYLVSADTPGLWAFHCHLLYHMDLGMFRTVVVS